tara:strand:+ start:818 stop:1672 length:855 start_codon:yes stop_codon:yes gene_type:complete
LKRALQSVLDQTYSEIECIVVDDASKDNTREMIASFKDDRLRYFRHEKNMGASAARNTGIRHSKGELVAFLDDDDEWISSKLEKQVPFLQSLPEKFGMVYCWMNTYNDKGQLISEVHPELKGNIFPYMLDSQNIGGCPTLLVKREVIEKVKGFDESLPRGNDGDFIRRISQKYEVSYIPEVLVRIYSGHGYGQISNNDINGIVNAIRSQKVKLKKFKKELDQYPYQVSNIYTTIAFDYGVIMKWKESIVYYIKAIYQFPVNPNIYRKIMASIRAFILFVIRRYL